MHSIKPSASRNGRTLMTKTEQFWVEVYNFQDNSGEQRFKELALFAFSLLTVPLSNADVKQVFSEMKNV